MFHVLHIYIHIYIYKVSLSIKQNVTSLYTKMKLGMYGIYHVKRCHSSNLNEQVLKGTVRQKPRWVKSGINRWLFLYCLAADILIFNFKRHYSLKSIKLASAFNDHKNKLGRINVASAADSLYW